MTAIPQQTVIFKNWEKPSELNNREKKGSIWSAIRLITMTDKQKLIEDTKQLITSILTSEKYGLSLKKLEHEFQEFIGRPIRYDEMGFNSARDFFLEISDAVKVTQAPDGTIHLDVISNEKIARVRNLVERQKDPLKRNRSGNYRGHGGRGSHRRGPPRTFHQQRPYHQHDPSRAQPRYAPRHSQQYTRVGQTRQQYSGGGQTRQQYSGQTRRPYEDEWNTPTEVLPNETRNYQAQHSSRENYAIRESADYVPPPPPQEALDRFGANQNDQMRISSTSGYHGTERLGPRDVVEYQRADHMPSVPATFRGRILDLLISYPNGLLASSFVSVYERRYHERLSVGNMGFATHIDMLQSMSDIIDLEDMPNGAIKIHQKKLRGIPGKALSFSDLVYDQQRPNDKSRRK